MRQGGSNNRRSRGRHHGGMGGGNGPSGPSVHNNQMGNNNRPRSAASLRHQTFDSNGPDVRVRGNAWQVYEKYQSLARDATGSGDRVAAENYQQHAEHYYRIIEAINEATALEQRQRGVPVTPYSQQPDVPANYYSADGSIMPQEGASATPSAEAGSSQPQQAQAEVQPKSQPVSQMPANSSDPFFSKEETEEENPSEPLVARR